MGISIRQRATDLARHALPAASSVCLAVIGGVAIGAHAGCHSQSGTVPSASIERVGQGRATVLADQPVAYYRFDETSGTVALDSSANEHHGTYAGSHMLGQPGAQLDDPNPSVLLKPQGTGGVLAPSSLDPWGADFSLEAWVWLNRTPTWRDPVFTRETYQTNGFRFGIDADRKLAFWTSQSGSTGELVGGTALTLGAWHHIAVTRDDGLVTLFVDGGEDGSCDVPMNVPTGGGRWGSLASNFATDARLDEAAVFDTALSPARIAAHHAAGVTIVPHETYPASVLADAPLAYHRLGELTGSVAADHSGNGHAATYAGSFTPGGVGAIDDDDPSVRVTPGDVGRVELPVAIAPWGDNFTLEAWVMPHDTPTWRAPVFVAETYLQAGFRFGFDASHRLMFWASQSGGTGDVVSTSSVAVDSWHHVAVTRAGSNITLYLDGVDVGGGQVEMTTPTGGGRWGSLASNMATDASLDELAVYGAALPATRIAEHHQAGLAGGPFDASVLHDGPIAYYRASETTGDIAADSSGNGHTAAYDGSFRTGAAGAVLAGDNGGVVFEPDDLGRMTMPATVDPWSGDFSFSLWIALHELPVWRAYVLTRETYLVDGFRFAIDAAGRPVFWTSQSGGSGEVLAQDALTLHQWQHLTVTRQGTTVSIYIDGELAGTGPVTMLPPTGGGRWGGYGGVGIAAHMDEFAVYDAALSPGRVASHVASREICAAPKTTLTASGPVVASRDGEVIENLRIVSTHGPAVLVDGHSDVTIRNCEIVHRGGHGIHGLYADRLRIEDVIIDRGGVPVSGGSSGDFQNINIVRSDDLRIARARLSRGAKGIYIFDSDDPYLNQIEIHDQRGVDGENSGHSVQFNQCERPYLEDFSIENDLDTSYTSDNVSNYQSSHSVIRRGLIDGNNHPSGCAVQTEHDSGAQGHAVGGLYQDIDAINQQCCFAGYPAFGLTMQRTRCKDTHCSSAGCRPVPASQIVWVSSPNAEGAPDVPNVTVEDSQYFNHCRNVVKLYPWSLTTTEQDTRLEDFVPSPPLRLSFCWDSAVDTERVVDCGCGFEADCSSGPQCTQ